VAVLDLRSDAGDETESLAQSCGCLVSEIRRQLHIALRFNTKK
jgi:hypothetical protein